MVDKDLQARFDEALIEHITETCTSFEQYGGESFRNLIGVLSKRVKVKHPTTLSRMVDKNADVVLKEITNIIRSSTFLYYISLPSGYGNNHHRNPNSNDRDYLCRWAINYIRSVKDDLVSLGFTSDLWTSRSLDSYISLLHSALGPPIISLSEHIISNPYAAFYWLEKKHF